MEDLTSAPIHDPQSTPPFFSALHSATSASPRFDCIHDPRFTTVSG